MAGEGKCGCPYCGITWDSRELMEQHRAMKLERSARSHVDEIRAMQWATYEWSVASNPHRDGVEWRAGSGDPAADFLSRFNGGGR